TQEEDLAAIWQEYFRINKSGKLAEMVSYKNTKGESWRNSVEDILMHVVMHSAYHRGQIAADMRAAGHSPAYTDFIHGIRQRLVEGNSPMVVINGINSDPDPARPPRKRKS